MKQQTKHLLPIRHPQGDLFICDVADAVLKDDMASMEHPVFALSKKPDTTIRRYEHNGNYVEITPSVKGLATIYDKDILIYCISQIMAKINQGVQVSQYLNISIHNLLIFINRGTGGKDYKAIKDSFERLKGTVITTNVKTGGEEECQGFGLIDSFKIKRSDKTGNITEVNVRLSDWIYRSIAANEVLTLNRDYFRLGSPIERRVYEIVRKHCGNQEQWRVSMTLLQKKCGSNAPLGKFRFVIKKLVSGNHLPDYSIEIDDEDFVIFRNRNYDYPSQPDALYIHLDADILNDASIVAPGYDIKYLEQEWRNWWADSGYPTLHSPGKAFVAFCAARYKRNPNP